MSLSLRAVLFAALFNLAGLPVMGVCLQFAAPAHDDVQDYPLGVVAADFNGDGRPDLAVANSNSDSLSVLLRTAGGSFAPAVHYLVGGYPFAVAAADFDGDGVIDLVTANHDSSDLTLLEGDGLGAFTTAATLTAGESPIFVAAADVNRDGRLDIVNISSGNVSILLGDGAGNFASESTFAAGGGPQSLAVADLDRDGDLDFAVANAGSISIVLGDGAGSFAGPVSFTTSIGGAVSTPRSITAADFDGDGDLDLAVADSFASSAVVLLGNGAGSFAAPAAFATGPAPVTIVSSDFDGDGAIDLALGNYSGNNVSLLIGDGDGAFAAAVDQPTGIQPTGITVADFNGDAKPDLVTSNWDDNDGVSVLINESACFVNCGTFGDATSFAAGSDPSSIATGDFDRNGTLDVVVANESSNNVSVKLGNGLGGFGSSTTHSTGTAPVEVVVADFNRDGKLDLAVANNGSHDVSVLRGDGSGGFSSASTFAAGTNPSGPRSLAVGDFDGDGAPDLAVTCGTSMELAILRNTATAGGASVNFSASTISSIGTGSGPRGVGSGDFNGDGRADLAVANFGDGFSSGTLIILRGNGSGGFSSDANIGVGRGPEGVWVGDVNGDGRDDVAVANSISNTVALVLADGTGFGSPSFLPTASGPRGITWADADRDGIVELFAATAAANAMSIVAADFDGDGDIDLATANSGSNDMSVRLNSCPPPDLTISKTHIGSFKQGETGSYTITVTNIATVPTAGAVVVTDTLPMNGLLATAISGSGWDCTLATLTCTRSDSLAAATSYPPITLAVSLTIDSPAEVINTATVSGGGDASPGNNTATDPTTVRPASPLPVHTLVATAISTAQVNLSWNPVRNGNTYRIYRKHHNSSFALLTTIPGTTYSDTDVVAIATYQYYVIAVNSENVASTTRNVDLATTYLLDDDPLIARTTAVKALHHAQLRVAVDSVRTCAGLGSALYTNAVTAGGIIRAVDTMELRTALDEARVILEMPAITYTDASLAGLAVKAAHLQEIRAGTQ